ncbi:hypothetical protein P8C59_001492 [Phyllachora maydis]|uniref:DNA mismatch repair protein PMS1 n=1 Tax=Phyllachora maydis TaxID=1825666 RepID=A0AAD9HYJ9_9PEZI|nr:hypothetical protein P8C59_001492 [Phyllachora maydis]
MAASTTIKVIDPSTVHQIQSGQVIVDLCSVAKELVENSVDAGATSIDVRFKNQGLDSIEVQDNGSGISLANHASLALKHYTSKLSSYDDLSTLQTFGFRGEALSSLCALSKFSVVTCTAEEAPKANKLEFASSGTLENTSIVSGQKGTTVYVENLFRNLPVRRRELERNIKREWGKVISLLSQYACIQTGIKFTVSQQPNKGKKMVLFSTRGNLTTRENIINVFGVKTMNALVALDLALEMEPTTGPGRRSNTQSTQSNDSAVTMFYVNGRPCGLPQFAKVLNEVYRSYNSSQSPFIFADIQLDTHLYDVNVSPDKRTILLHDQGQGGIESQDAEAKLSLKITKSDFGRMKIVGQFNLGFIIAVRGTEPGSRPDSGSSTAQARDDDDDDDELFIIDQHASDEKFNFERLQASTVVQSQRLVQPKTLELTAVEEEIIGENLAALEANGFVVQLDESGDRPVGSRCQLLSLPLSRETTFSVADLEELVFLLGDQAAASAAASSSLSRGAAVVPRPAKVRKMFAMRACRSSIMIGTALTQRQMRKAVRHMGEMEKPWNCPHGRPTMRHLCGLGAAWDGRSWLEDEDLETRPRQPDWRAWVRQKRGTDRLTT